MVKNEVKDGDLIMLPKDVRAIRSFLSTLFDTAIVYNDPAFVYDLVAVLAWRANTERSRMSSRLKGSSAHRFVEAIDDAFARWENHKRKLSPKLRIYLCTALFENACERASFFMKREQWVGLSESIF